jgi:hypothetical protein
MQVSATLIAAQQAAREARARLQVPQQQAAPQAGFAAALEKTTGVSQDFAPLPLKQAAAPAASSAPAQQAPQPGARLGQHINIVI